MHKFISRLSTAVSVVIVSGAVIAFFASMIMHGGLALTLALLAAVAVLTTCLVVVMNWIITLSLARKSRHIEKPYIAEMEAE